MTNPPEANGFFPAMVDLSFCQNSVLNRTVTLTASLTKIGHALMDPPVEREREYSGRHPFTAASQEVRS